MYLVWKYKLDHAAFWLLTALFYAFIRRNIAETSGWWTFTADVLSRNLLIALACYANIYLLFEKFFKRKKYLLYTGSLIVLLLVYTALQDAAIFFLYQTSFFLAKSYYHFSVGLFYIAFTLALELSKRWYRQELVLHKIESEKLHTELQYLKAQLNPHFLFNCINSIYFQIDEENAEARESLRKFSEMLRYQLYECNEDQIPIEKEMRYLESYVDLQRLRKNSNNNIAFRVDESMESFRIAPLLLLPFVENAFKHLSGSTDLINTIELDMHRKNGTFMFSVKNTFDDHKVSSHGIGLKNVRRRLDLLYPGKYVLNINRSDREFSVNLQLDI